MTEMEVMQFLNRGLHRQPSTQALIYFRDSGFLRCAFCRLWASVSKRDQTDLESLSRELALWLKSGDLHLRSFREPQPGLMVGV